MSGRGILPDEAFVVRGGRPPFSKSLRRACDQHPEGNYGFSVQAEAGLTVAELGRFLRNPRVGFTTVGEVRRMGYEVVRTTGLGFHATLVVPTDWEEADASRLAQAFQDAENPNPARAR